jgi:hypothetical protein
MGILSILVSRLPQSEALPRAEARSRQNVRPSPGRPLLLVGLSQHHTESQCLVIWMCSKKIRVTPLFTPPSDKYSKIAEDVK